MANTANVIKNIQTEIYNDTLIENRKKQPDSETWNQVNRKRGRGSPNENSTIKKRQTIIKDYWLANPTSTNNAFKVLENKQETDEEINGHLSETDNTGNKQKPQKSPPIFVSGVENICPLKTLLDSIVKNEYTLKVLSNNEVKIQPHSSEKYLPIIEELKRKNTEFYTYQRKQDKGYKVVLRNMHPTVDTNELKSEIEKFEHKVIRIANIKQRITHKALPLFFIEIESKENNKKIYEINKLLNLIVSFEPPRKKRDIPQCMKCQDYGHTKNYCHKNPVCVKCAQNHLTALCPIKGKIQEVKCVNCNGNHPASYKGCIVRKQLQQKLFPTLRTKRFDVNINSHENQIQNNNVRSNVSYAQAVNGNVNDVLEESKQTQVQMHSSTTNNSSMEGMMIKLMNRMDTMLNLLTTLINRIK